MDRFSFLNATHVSFISEMYDRYLQAPDTLEPSWRAFFQGFDFGTQHSGGSPEEEVGAPASTASRVSTENELPQHIQKEFQVIKLIDGYRTRGHLFTKTNPVRSRRTYTPNLDIENFGLTASDLNTIFSAGSILGIGAASLSAILGHLQSIYCGSIGVEYMYIRQPEEVEWIQQRLNKNQNQPNFNADQKKHILRKLSEAVNFETFLHTKYVGQKRFSLEGGESLIPALDALVESAAASGVEHFVLGMAHRGRLNVLTNIFGKSPRDIFNEFDGKEYEIEEFDGDVKYHLGWTSDRKTDNGKQISLNISPNPSHLETVTAVVQGIARAKQEKYASHDFSKVLPIVIHGDAAIAGQGIVYEVVQMANLEGYKTNGTIHIVVNNQVGFTTNYVDARSSTYCTDVGKITLSPVLHVNADDTEAVVHASNFALEFRMAFKRDVFIDLLGYRKYGHNEGDEPRFTQPKLYKLIETHKNPMLIYAEKLIQQGVITQSYLNELEEKYKAQLEQDLESAKKASNIVITPFMQNEWEGFKIAEASKIIAGVDTSYNIEKLSDLAHKITELPKDKVFIRKIEKLISDRKKMFFETNALDWAMGELLAYATLLEEGFNVRISGQDVERGTFSHRHAVIKAEDSEEKEILLENVSENQGVFRIHNSLLSEYGVLGFEYGYAMTNPNTLVVWEAQFGDFSNGGQIVIDQYLSSGEDKWKNQNGIVLYLPHGYENQGAEHSSARVERYLQLCSKKNMIIANCTTPANLFHLLRRQMKSDYRKPLVVLTPKSLLRHPKVVSTKEELSNSNFQLVIDDRFVNPKKVKTLVFCTGKFYYDLLNAREQRGLEDIALVRIEQLFPLPKDEITKIISKYNCKDMVWAQEEPLNMGAWSFLLLHLPEAKNFRVASRDLHSSPAPGSSSRDKRYQEKAIESVFLRP